MFSLQLAQFIEDRRINSESTAALFNKPFRTVPILGLKVGEVRSTIVVASNSRIVQSLTRKVVVIGVCVCVDSICASLFSTIFEEITTQLLTLKVVFSRRLEFEVCKSKVIRPLCPFPSSWTLSTSASKGSCKATSPNTGFHVWYTRP